MSESWIKLYRKIWENPTVTKDTEHLAVWMFLLTNATYKEKSVYFKGKKIKLHSGQLITGRKAISDTTKVNESKVLRILKRFEKDNQIKQEKSNKGTLVTILNWSAYQESKSSENQKRETSEQVISDQRFISQMIEQASIDNNIQTASEQQINSNHTTDAQRVNTFKKKEKRKEDKKSTGTYVKENCMRNQRVPTKQSNSFHNFEQREYPDALYDLLESNFLGFS